MITAAGCKNCLSQSILKRESRKTTCTSKNEPAEEQTTIFIIHLFKKKVEKGLSFPEPKVSSNYCSAFWSISSSVVDFSLY